MNHWVMKSKPNDFSIDDLRTAPGRETHWDGVRNYQARNFMRDQMKQGNLVFSITQTARNRASQELPR